MDSLSFLDNDQILKQKTSAMWVRIVLRLSFELLFELEVENWLLTLSARSLKLETFSGTKHLSVFSLMCSCFLDAVQTLLGSNPYRNPYSFSSPPTFSQEKFGRGAAKKSPNLESHLNTNDARL